MTNSESLQTALDRYWALGAMALTSSISLFLLWLLFRKPQDERASVKTTVSDKEQVADSTVMQTHLISDENITPSALESSGSSTSNISEIEAAPSPLNSKVAHIDVVHELIQDLQSGNSESKNTSNNKYDSKLQVSRRRKAIWKLTKTGDYRSIEPLVKIMPEAAETDRSLIVEAVSKITSRSFKPIEDQLFANLQDLNPEVRLNAVRDIKHLYQFVTPAIAKIALMQSDPDYQVRQTAIQTIKQLSANPLPAFDRSVAQNSASEEMQELVSGDDSEANLHLVAYLLAELDDKE